MYQHGKRTKRKSNPKIFVQAVFVFGLSLIIVAYILRNDMTANHTEKTAVPIVTEVTKGKEEKTKINEPLFSLELPNDWERVGRVQNSSANYYEWHSTTKGGDDRSLKLHIDILPATYKLVRILPVTVNGTSLSLGNVSGNCMDFAKDITPGSNDNSVVTAKWENVVFNCDPINANQTIGTGTVGASIGSIMEGSSGKHNFFFVYSDHNVRIDDRIFIEIVKSFRIR